jgi:hypothetical protein
VAHSQAGTGDTFSGAHLPLVSDAGERAQARDEALSRSVIARTDEVAIVAEKRESIAAATVVRGAPASTMEHWLDSSAGAPLLLRRSAAAASTRASRDASPQGEMSRHRAPDSVSMQAGSAADAMPATSAAEGRRASVPAIAGRAADTQQFDALVERLIARLSMEARRQGRYRWR